MHFPGESEGIPPQKNCVKSQLSKTELCDKISILKMHLKALFEHMTGLLEYLTALLEYIYQGNIVSRPYNGHIIENEMMHVLYIYKLGLLF